MAVQAKSNVATYPFILHSYPANRVKGTIKQNESRTEPLAPFTVLAKIAATGLYVPLTDVTATDGSAIPAGIYIGPEIAAATLVAGNVSDCAILKSGARVDKNQIVLENSLELDSTITSSALTFDAGTGDATATLAVTDVKTIGDYLELRMLVPVDTDQDSAYEA